MVQLKTFIITISLLVLLFLVGIGGCIYYYENKVNELERMLNADKNPSGITILPESEENVTNSNIDTNINNVVAE